MYILLLFILLFALIGMLGWQFLYLLYLDRIGNERRQKIYELESENQRMSQRIQRLENQIREPMPATPSEIESISETWADVIGDN